MKANWIAGGLLLVLYLLWLTATAPARLLAPMLPPGVQVGQFSGSVWRGARQRRAEQGGSKAEQADDGFDLHFKPSWGGLQRDNSSGDEAAVRPTRARASR